MAHVTNNSMNVRSYYYSSVNTGKARSDIIEEFLNCSWMSAEASKQFILSGFYDVSVKQGAQQTLLLLRIGQNIPYQNFNPIHTIVKVLENFSLDQISANMHHWLYIVSACLLISVMTIQVGGNWGLLWREISKASVSACSSGDAFFPTQLVTLGLVSVIELWKSKQSQICGVLLCVTISLKGKGTSWIALPS